MNDKKTRKFLTSAVAIAAALLGGQAQATVSAEEQSTLPTFTAEQVGAVEFVIAPAGAQLSTLNGHQSHSSHESHASHASHASHSSHASHQSYAG